MATFLLNGAYTLAGSAVAGAILFYCHKRVASKKGASNDEVTSAPSHGTFTMPSPEPLKDFVLEKALPLAYRPFKHGHNPITMGTRMLAWDDWLFIDSLYPYYHEQKDKGLTTHLSDHVAQLDPERTSPAIYELLEEVVRFHTTRYPSIFQQKGDEVHNRVTGECYHICGITPIEAFETCARMTQEDLILMFEHEDGMYYFDAGAVCLPGFWRLRDKLGQSLDELHLLARVAHYKERLQPSMNKFFRTLRPEKPVTRNNFFIQVDGELAHSFKMGTHYGTDHMSWTNAKSQDLKIEDIHFRTERQTIRRLPKSEAIVFAVRTYMVPMKDLAAEPHVPGRFAEAVRNWTTEMGDYKGRALRDSILLDFLDEKHREQIASGVLEKEPELEYPM